MNFDTEFKKNLIKKFDEKKYGKSKDKSLGENSIKLYIRNLEKLNDDTPLKNLNYLKDIDNIKNKIENYKENTKRGYLISICSALATEKDTNKNKNKIYQEYYKLLSEKNSKLKKLESKNELTEQQKKNWITWEDVKNKFNELEEKINNIKNYKEINFHNYNLLLQYIVLALYYYKQPRRNQDYYKMRIIKSYTPNNDSNFNYLDYDNKQFIFNVYKTSKKDGMQKEDIPDKLFEIIKLYLKFHPLIKGKRITKNDNIPFLVYYDGKTFNEVNCITRILNKIFEKSVGSSMLRHIYLSDKYGEIIKEQKKDADAMGHSINQQKDYIKIK